MWASERPLSYATKRMLAMCMAQRTNFSVEDEAKLKPNEIVVCARNEQKFYGPLLALRRLHCIAAVEGAALEKKVFKAMVKPKAKAKSKGSRRGGKRSSKGRGSKQEKNTGKEEKGDDDVDTRADGEEAASKASSSQRTQRKRPRKDSGPASSLSSRQVKKLKVADLRAELESRGLETDGLKAALVQRLETALTQPQ